MLKKRIIVTAVCFMIIGCLTWFIFPNHPVEVTKTPLSSSYQVYKSDGSIITLTPSPQHPLIFFATWCPDCQKDLAGKTDPDAYYIDTFTKEPGPKNSFKAVQDFIKTYHTDPNTQQYFVSVDQNPQGIPSIPYTITK